MKNLILGSSAALASLAVTGIAQAGVYIPMCYYQWFYGPFGWYQQWVCY